MSPGPKEWNVVIKHPGYFEYEARCGTGGYCSNSKGFGINPGYNYGGLVSNTVVDLLDTRPPEWDPTGLA